MAAYSGIDVLVNNAGGTMWTRFEDITDMSIFERLMRVNYLGAVYCTCYALPGNLPTGTWAKMQVVLAAFEMQG